MNGPILIRPFISVQCPGTKDGLAFYFVTYHFAADEEDILWSGHSHATALLVARRYAEEDRVPVIDRVTGAPR